MTEIFTIASYYVFAFSTFLVFLLGVVFVTAPDDYRLDPTVVIKVSVAWLLSGVLLTLTQYV